MGTPAPTALGKLGIGPADPVTVLVNAMDFDPGVSIDLRDTNATRGAYEKDGNRTVPTRTIVAPRLSTEPSALEMLTLLEWGMYGTPTGTTTKTFPLSVTPKEMYTFWSPNNGNLWFLSGVGVDTMTISATQGEPLRMEFELLGKTSTNTHAAFPALTPDQTYRPFTLSQLVITVGGITKNCREFSYRIAHNLDRNRFLNSDTLTDLVPLRRDITCTLDVPAGDNADLWNDGIAGAAVAATFTNASGSVFTLAFPDWRFQPRSPTSPQDGEGFLRLEGQLYRGPAQASPAVLTMTTG